MKYVLLLVLLVFFVSCDKGAKTPEGLLNMYVQDLVNKNVDKEYFEKYTTGKLWDSVAELSEEEFKDFIKTGSLKNPRIDISNKSCLGSQCTLTYIIKYDVNKDDKRAFKSEVKKVATLVKDGEFWKISEVSNVKTFIEAEQGIDITSP